MLKVTAEYRAESEEEAKQMNEDFKEAGKKRRIYFEFFCLHQKGKEIQRRSN